MVVQATAVCYNSSRGEVLSTYNVLFISKGTQLAEKKEKSRDADG